MELATLIPLLAILVLMTWKSCILVMLGEWAEMSMQRVPGLEVQSMLACDGQVLAVARERQTIIGLLLPVLTLWHRCSRLLELNLQNAVEWVVPITGTKWPGAPSLIGLVTIL